MENRYNQYRTTGIFLHVVLASLLAMVSVASGNEAGDRLRMKDRTTTVVSSPAGTVFNPAISPEVTTSVVDTTTKGRMYVTKKKTVTVNRPTGTVIDPPVGPVINVPSPPPYQKKEPVFHKKDDNFRPHWRDDHQGPYEKRRYYPKRDKYNKHWSGHGGGHHYGSRHRRLPHDSYRFYLGSSLFFYSSGLYYRQAPDGYVIVEAPIGARVHSLPSGCNDLYVRGRTCYVCDDVYYEKVGTEYLVIEQPQQFTVIAAVGDEVQVEADSLNVRSGPGRNHAVVSRLYRNDIVEVGGVSGSWYYIRSSGGVYGWIMSKYTSLYAAGQNPQG